ncbi:hypothetical protein Ocin01_05816 [Orchesella cincta]|uniref:Nuclear pore complex protein n=1 Tax=Orchesella cincta TaxID=48709 RepID=A0A1D2N6G4_ORCCI|nr:hypothetical protein Ocin01_05816 [Orchesella cincta]
MMRTLNDTLELTEISMDHNLFDNQVRYIFQNSPIVGPITIHETDTNIVILVATVTSVHRFVFIHPKRMPELPADKSPLGNNKPSIFYQICNKPQMSFRSFNLYDNAINLPVPLSATCFFVQSSLYPSTQPASQLMVPQQFCSGESFFAFSYENGSVQVLRISKDDTLTNYDLNQANLLFISNHSGSGTSYEAVIGLQFFTARVDRGPKSLFLVTLAMNGHLKLWMGNNLQGTVGWTSLYSEFINRNVADGMLTTDSSMLLKKSNQLDLDELPFFVIYVPGDGFRIYNVLKGVVGQNFSGGSQAVPGSSQFVLQEARRIDFRERELIDFTVTPEYLHLLINNPEEEIEWEVKSYNLKESLNPRFNLALLEPLPLPDVPMSSDSVDPKEFYMDLVFNKSSFNKNTIIQALTMFKKDEDDLINDQDWNSLKITAMNVVDREIAFVTSTTDFELSDDDYTGLCNKYWMMFYSSCVEYHIHTVKPLGLFYETNTRMLCIVKKSRISFLRPTDSLETLYYFPHCVQVSENIDGGDDRMIQLQMMLKFFELLDVIESTMGEDHRQKMDRNLRTSHVMLESVSEHIANLLTEADPRSLHLEYRHFISLITVKLKDIGELGDQALRHVLSLLLTWERDGAFVDPAGGDAEEDMDTGGPMVTEFFMGSRLGAHLSYKILKQLLHHRYMISRNTVILQSICIRYFSQNNEQEGIYMLPTWNERREAVTATTYYFALLELAEEYFEYSRPITKDKGLKVANSLKAFTSDHLKNENFMDVQWPMRLMESFCISNLGGLSIRSRVSRSKKSGILAYAEAAGRSILPNDPTTRDHPLEEFLIVTCQYSTLMKYAQYMTTYFPLAKGTLRKFYLGLSHLCLHNFDTSLNYFQSISFREACDDYLDFNGNENLPFEKLQELYSGYFLKIIKLFEIYDQTPAIQRLAEDGLKIASDIDNDAITRMCTLAFRSAIKLDDYKSAYKYIQQIPSAEGTDGVKERKEKLASLRIFLARIIEKGDVQTLMTLDMADMFNKISTVREKVEDILGSQANLSDPLQRDGVYQILCFYHVSLQNFHKAASAMYIRVIQLGERGRGLEGLIAQNESLLDVLTCLSLVENKDYRFVIRKTGVTPKLPEPTISYDKVTIPPLLHEQYPLEVRNYDDILKELKLIGALIKIAQFLPPNPVKSTEFESRVQQAIDVLTQHHFYDDALNLAKVWGKPVDATILCFTSSCVFLQRGIFPQTGDPYDYIRHIDISELPNSNTDVLELAFRTLHNYLMTHEKPAESGLYQKVAVKFLSCGVQLPQWLIDDYKRRNCSQLLRCYMTYGKWEEATTLVVNMIDAVLGRRPQEEFDASIQKISSYDPVEPVLPFTDINVLANEMKLRGKTEHHLINLHITVKEAVRLFCDRVEECTAERKRLYCVE